MKQIPQISWKAISEEFKARSSDDVRHFFINKIMPKLLPNFREWTKT
jgi:hypothetical protein